MSFKINKKIKRKEKKIVALLVSILFIVTLSQAVTLTIIQQEGTVTMTRSAGSRIKLKSVEEGIKWWKVREGNVEVEYGSFIMVLRSTHYYI